MNSLIDIYFRMTGKIIVEPTGETLSANKMATVMKNLSIYGYGLAPSMIEALSDKTIVNFYNIADNMLKTTLGADKNWSPMYPNFPEQVMGAEDTELYLKALSHYTGILFGKRVMPVYQKEERSILAESFDGMKFIELGTMDDFYSVMRKNFDSATEYTPQFKDDVLFLLEEEGDSLMKCFPESFTNKENMAFVVRLLASKGKDFSTLSKTATDVLRIAVVLSDGDISLASKTMFRNFKRAERRSLLSMLDRCSNLEEDMLRHRGKWIRLGEYLHPREYNKFKNANQAFSTLRNNPSSIETFNSKTEGLLKSGDIKAVCDHLKARPSEFARRLNALLSKKMDYEYVTRSFIEVADDVSEKILLELLSYFSSRDVKDLRVFFPKGQVGKAKCIEDKRCELPVSIRTHIVGAVNNSLIKRFAKKDPLGKVYIDPRLEDYVVPFANRSASKALNTQTRGTRLPLSADNTVRFFLWWRDLDKGNNEYRNTVDVDLSAVFFKDDWSHHSQVSYTNLRNGIKSCHSGDITSAPNGACEFIDVDIESAISGGARYVAMCAYSYSQQPFSDIPDCFVGWMERSEPDSGEIFEAKTVKNRVDLDTDGQVVVPMVIDLVERKVIWMDLVLTNTYTINSTEFTRNSVSVIGKAVTEMKKPDMYTLISLNAQARGEIVDNPDEADVEFSLPKVRPEDYECL